MCQVTPFTYPCCKRIYVLVEKLPNCPADWPKSKCPQELCIQVIDTETAQVKQSSTGICWRCMAAAEGKAGTERESMRPEIDRAAIVEGLEELDVVERRRRAEAGGNCWYCGARHGCSKCGIKKSDTATEASSPSLQRKKRRSEDRKGPTKKSKVRSPLRSQLLFNGFPQLALHQPGPIPTQYHCLPTPHPVLEGFPTYQINSHQGLPAMSDGSRASAWQTSLPYTDYTAFWQNFHSTQGHKSEGIRRIQQTQDADPNLEGDPPLPRTHIVLDPGGLGGHDQASLSPRRYFCRHIMTVCRRLIADTINWIMLGCMVSWMDIAIPLVAKTILKILNE
jgi:hypothetical protein